MDALCLNRALDLLEYWHREAKAQGSVPGRAAVAEPSRSEPPTEVDLESQFAMMPRANPQQVGFDQNISRIPPELRDIVNWAEGMKEKHKLN